jgi:Tol biopolymer transport system component
MNVDGTGLTRLTDDPAWDGQPAFNLDGSQIAFTSGRGDIDDIYIMNVDGTQQTNLTNNAAGHDARATFGRDYP